MARMIDTFEASTERPWFVHDFSDACIGGTGSPHDITISCTSPDHLTVASMGRGLTATLDEARANAALIVAAVSGFDSVADENSRLSVEIGNVKAENAMLRQMVIELEAKLAMAGGEGERDERT